jgi:hypothetical protein
MWWWTLVPYGRKILYRRRVAAAREVQLAARLEAATHSPSVRRVLEQAAEHDQAERNAAFARILNQARGVG